VIERVELCIRKLEETYPQAGFYLIFSNSLELLVGALLSTKVKDEVVNSVLPRLFAKYKSADQYATAPFKTLVKDILPISFASVKARRLKDVCKILTKKYDGKVPDTLEELLTLPGIGRKTANTILINAFGKVEGIPVDTNVVRVSYRLGWTRSKQPSKIEKDITSLVPRKYWKNLPYLMKRHGRAICKPRIPLCSNCVLFKLCERQNVEEYG